MNCKASSSVQMTCILHICSRMNHCYKSVFTDHCILSRKCKVCGLEVLLHSAWFLPCHNTETLVNKPKLICFMRSHVWIVFLRLPEELHILTNRLVIGCPLERLSSSCDTTNRWTLTLPRGLWRRIGPLHSKIEEQVLRFTFCLSDWTRHAGGVLRPSVALLTK